MDENADYRSSFELKSIKYVLSLVCQGIFLCLNLLMMEKLNHAKIFCWALMVGLLSDGCIAAKSAIVEDQDTTREVSAAPLEAFEVLVAGPENVDIVLEALKSDSTELKLSGLFAAGRVNGNKNKLLEFILPLLDDDDAQVRAVGTSVLPFMIHDDNQNVIFRAIDGMTRDRVMSVRLSAMETIEHLEADGLALLPALKRAATDPDPVVKMVAVTIACSVAKMADQPERALPIALVLLSDRNQKVRVAAANGLSKLGIGMGVVFEKLSFAADDPSADVRAASLLAMRSIDAPRAWGKCIAGIDDSDARVVAVAGACLKGVRGEVVTQLIDRFRDSNESIGRAMAILLAGAHPSAAEELNREVHVRRGPSRALMEYSLWHLSRRAGLSKMVSRWNNDGDWNHEQLKGVIREIVGFSSMNASLESVKEACSSRWGGSLVLLEGGEELQCSNHHLLFTHVAVQMVIQDFPSRKTSRYVAYDEENDLSVQYQARFQLQGSDELGLQVAVLQLLEDSGCRYIPDRLPESAACVGPGGNVEVRLIPGAGIELIKPLAIY